MDGDLRRQGFEERLTALERRVRALELQRETAARAAPTVQRSTAAPPPAPALPPHPARPQPLHEGPTVAWRYEPASSGEGWPRVVPAASEGAPATAHEAAAARAAATGQASPGHRGAAAREQEFRRHEPVPAAAPAVRAEPAQSEPAPPEPAESPTAFAPGPPRGLDLRDLEERFAGRALAWIGALALVAAAVFFLSLAFSRGWINEPMRVLIGLAAGSAALGVGALSFDRRNPLLGNVLTAAGLGIVTIALFAATRAYGLVAPEVGLLGALAASVAAAVIAIRFDAREVAAFGLIAALIAPPVMGASPNTLTLLFMGVTLIGTTAIALFRSWRWLPAIAFILAAPQLASWLMGGADTVQELIALTAFWLVNIMAAGGEEVRIRRDDLRPSSASLVLANAAFLVWGGVTVLSGDLHAWLGTFVAVASVAHLAVGGAFLRRQGQEHLFGNLVAGTGVALLALAAFEQFGAALVPVAWAAEAAALAWLAVRRMHGWSALASVTLGALAVAHLVLVEYPLPSAMIGDFGAADTTWLRPEAASLGAVLVAMALVGWWTRIAWVRSVLVGVGALLAAYSAPFELTGPALPTAWVAIAVVALLVDAGCIRAATSDLFGRLGTIVRAGAGTLAAGIVGAVALVRVLAVEFPVSSAGLHGGPSVAVPWLHVELIPVLALLVAAGVVTWLWPARAVRAAALVASALLVGYVLTFEAGGALLIALLWIVAFAATELDPVIARRGTRGDLAWADAWGAVPWAGTAVGAWLRLTAIAVLVGVEYSPARLGAAVPAVPYSGEPALSLAIVLAGLALLGARLGTRGIRSAMAAIGVLLVAWSVPFELDGVARIAMLAVLLPVAAIGDSAIARLPDARRFAFVRVPPEAGGLCTGAGAVSWALGMATAVATYLRPIGWGSVTPPAIPFSDETALVAFVLAGSAIAAAAWAVTVVPRQLALLGAIVPLGLVVPLEVYADFVVVLWLVLAAAALAVTAPRDLLRPAAVGLGGLLGAGAVAVAFAIVAPPYRLWVADPALEARPPLLAGWWLAMAAVAALPYLASRRPSLAQYRSVLEVAAAAVAVYLVSVGVVDVFQRMAGGSIAPEELAKQAQVALSVTWTAIGALALGVGLRTRRAMPRHIGFALLALATAKVFVVDLAAMDVAYRAMVLAGLGVLLLLSAWLFTHLRGPHAGTGGLHGPRPAG